jgi:hypothetical protein
MNDLMGIKRTLIMKWLTTHITDIRTLSSMDMLMFSQSSLLDKGLITHITDIRMISSMYTGVFCEVTLKTETFTTQNAGIWVVIIMPEHMFFHSFQLTEQHISHITMIQSLLSMHDFRTLPIVSKGKWFVTNITSKWTYFTTHMQIMLLHITLHHARADDAAWDHSRTCYTHCKFASVDVSSDYA